MFDLAKRHRRYDKRLHQRVLLQDSSLVENLATPESKRLKRMHNEVMRCYHKKTGFMRFRQEGDTLFCRTHLEHDVIDLLLRHFHRRFPTHKIAIEADKKAHTIDQDGLIKTGGPRIINPTDEDNPCDETWGEYYESQRIISRQNHQLMRKMMPKKHMDKGMTEGRKLVGCRNLREFTG